MKKLLLLNAIIWAVIILVSAYLFKEHTYYTYLLGLLVLGSVLQNTFTYTMLKGKPGCK